jgi:hypothetical protein
MKSLRKAHSFQTPALEKQFGKMMKKKIPNTRFELQGRQQLSEV